MTPTTNITRQPITASVTLQAWQNDYAISLQTVTFDATAILADMTPQERANLEDGSDHADHLFHSAVERGLIPAHTGPFDVSIREALDAALEANPNYFDTPFPQGHEVRHENAILHTPLTPYEIGYRTDAYLTITGLITVSLADLVDRDHEELLDHIGIQLIGSELLMDISYEAVSVTGSGEIVLKVSGQLPVDFTDQDELSAFEDGVTARAARDERLAAA